MCEKKSLWRDMRGIKCLTCVGNRALETMVNYIPTYSTQNLVFKSAVKIKHNTLIITF